MSGVIVCLEFELDISELVTVMLESLRGTVGRARAVRMGDCGGSSVSYLPTRSGFA